MKILVTGASGQLGASLLDELAQTTHEVLARSGSRPERRGTVNLVPVDLTDLDALEAALASADPGAVIHAAAISSAEAVRLDRARAEIVNVRATRRIAEWVESRHRRLVFTSTDLVFDGTRPMSREDDLPGPLQAYGQTKLDAELALASLRTAVVARLPLLFGPTRAARPSFFDRAVAALRQGTPQTFFDDEYRTPLDYRSAARGLIQLATTDVAGIIHLAGLERMSRFELMTRSARGLGLDPSLVRANQRGDVPAAEPRPADVSLATTRWQTLFPTGVWPSVEEALKTMVG